MPTDCRLFLLDWTLVCGRREWPLLFSGLAFREAYIYVGDDNNASANPDRVAVWRFRDSGSDDMASPEPALKLPPGSGWGTFFRECDRFRRLWAGVRPIGGRGQVWCSSDGHDWRLVSMAAEESLPLWRGTHTFRDATLGQTGDGRSLSAPDATLLTARLSGAAALSYSSGNATAAR